jgi:glyoxylase-like metal-dependent hydrolase (beta-lactamase superfamily II)
LKRLEPARWKDTEKNRPDVAGKKSDGPEPPKQDINEPVYVLNDGSRKVEFHHYGWAHTRGDGFVYLPKEQILCTGDAAVNGPYNFTGDGNIGNWPTVLRTAEKLKVKTVLPGHGAPGGREVLSGQAQFMTELYKAVKAGVDQGKSVEDLQASVKLPETVSTWVSEGSLKAQVKDAYAEIKK